MAEASERMKKYFDSLVSETNKAYEIANKARKKGVDVVRNVEIRLAKNMAERVFGLISVVAPHLDEEKIINRIQELERKYEPLDWRVALTIALEVAQQKFGKFETEREAMEVGIRTGFTYQTVGIVAAPLEGFTDLEFKKRKDGKEYFSVKFSGPIRGAGGTGAAFCVLLSDFIRKKMGYAPYDPTDLEVKRYVQEIYDYAERVTVPQYLPTPEEIEFLVRHIPVEVSGEPTENIEVSNYKDLDRIETNRIRGGMVLVMAMIALKAPKLWKRVAKWGKEFDLDWMWLGDFLKLHDEIKSRAKAEESNNESKDKDEEKLKPNYIFISELVAGRPVFAYPLRDGGFRVRYGRARNTGFSSAGLHPATMAIVSDFIATGTQLKPELPGKGAGSNACDSIEPPIVLLDDGSVKKVKTREEAKKLYPRVKEILFLGDILYNYGDFSENNSKLVPAGYCPEWWFAELEKAIKDNNLDFNDTLKSIFSEQTLKNLQFPPLFVPTLEESIKASKELNVPLHPEYIFYWNQIKPSDIILILNALLDKSKLTKEPSFKLVIKADKKDNRVKRCLELIGLEHDFVNNEHIVVKGDLAKAFLLNLGIDENDYFSSIQDQINKISSLSISEFKKAVEVVDKLSEFVIRDKCGVFIGARMGRPEKAKMRAMSGSPHMLFPVSDQGDRLRSFNVAIEKGFVQADFAHFKCPKCNNETILPLCEKCGTPCEQMYYCPSCKKWMKEQVCPVHNTPNKEYSNKKVPLKDLVNHVRSQFNIRYIPPLIKGVRGTVNRDHVPEHFVKGILRAKYGIYVNKDGTIRFDMTELPITHFKPKEIHTSVEKLRELGYEKDIFGNPLVDEDQILEIFPQDIILPLSSGFSEGADEVFVRVAKFIDDLLETVYGLPRYYNVEKREDLIGKLVIGLAPHISAGMVGRIIGFSEIQALLASPLFHAALRRDCDGDEGCILLQMDAFLNFSKRFLPDRRGSRTMDAPLVLTTVLNPSEVDDMVLGLDVASRYPLEFYEATLQYKMPYEVHVEQLKDRIGTEQQYENYGFTHPVSNINYTNIASSYKTLETMMDKLNKEMEIAGKIRAVDASDVASLIIEKHFMKDLKGNLRKFSMQVFRCVNCNEKYRRVPLSGKCPKCGGKIIFTISEGSVTKYLQPSLELAEKYDVDAYIRDSLNIVKTRIDSLFGKEKEKQQGLSAFMNKS
ncbi:MAG: polymerase large subunit [Candidatus Woesearchaeota archaeon]|nr:polymerase large subunit [Candidatus Woesearchaeota archaeon]MDN5328138.1 polymerase large subunit [Candidatus Woesearchaeota archaeon]